MASTNSSLPSPGRRNLRRLLRLRSPAAASADQNSLASYSSSRPRPQAATTDGEKKKNFASPTFLGFGCASSASSQACAPGAAAAVVRSSADWQGKRTLQKRTKKKERHSSTLVAPVADVWCAPGIALAAVDDSVDCAVLQRDVIGRGFRRDAEMDLRERSSSWRAGKGNNEQISSLVDSFTSLQASLYGSDLMPSRHYNHMRGYNCRPQVELQEISLFENRISFRRGDSIDQYRNWRLDVDNMTYEELLDLGDKIGHVSTGLREEEIASIIRKVKPAIFDCHFSIERKCSICQEEFEMNVEVGKLRCGHSYHPYCIKKWLFQKNACPVCKATVSKN